MSRAGRIATVALVGAAGLLGAASTARAATRTWQGTSGGNWSTGSNWGGTAPQDGDAVVFDTDVDNCTIDVNTNKIASLTISSSYTGTITPSAGKSLIITGAYSQSRGTMNAAANTLIGGSFTLNGSSTATFNAGSGAVIIQGAYTQSTATTVFNGNTAYIVLGNTVTKSAGTFTPSTSTVLLAARANTDVPLGSFGGLWMEDPVETNLKIYFKFDEITGLTTSDTSGNGYIGTLKAGTSLPTWKTSALPGTNFRNRGAVTFTYSGTDNDSRVEFPIATNFNPITVAAWIYVSSADDGQGNPRIVDLPAFRVYTNSSSRIGVYSDRSGAAYYGGASTGDGNWQTNTTFSRDAWHHVAVTYTSEASCPCNNLPKVYLDGDLIASVAGDYSTVLQPTVTTLCSPVTGTIGNSAALTDDLNGSIDDVRIYDAVLMGPQIAALAAGDYTGSSSRTFTLTAATTASGQVSLYRGTMVTGSNNFTASDTSQAALFDWGSLTVGGSATARFDGGATFENDGTLTMHSSGGIVSLGSTKTLTMDGTLDVATTGTLATIKAVSGNYAFSIGSTATATPTLDVSGLNVQNTDANGMYINATGAAGPVTTIDSFEDVNFSAGNTSSGSTLLRIYSTSMYLNSNNSGFDRTSMHATSYNVKMAGNGTADGETRAVFGNTACLNTSGVTETCESSDSDDDSTNDGIGDNSGSNSAVVQFVKQAYSESHGTIAGFPTPSFSWTNFQYWRTYSAFNDDDGAGANKLYARDDSGSAAAYSWSIDGSTGTFVGVPRWDMEGGTHYVYVVTSLGYVYKVTDDGSSLATAAGYPYHHTTGGSGATATSSLVMDATSVYWAGNDGAGARKLFRVTRSSGALSGTPRAISADIYAGLSIGTVVSTNYLFAATNLITTNGKIYKISLDLTTEYGSMAGAQSTTNISGRLTIYNGVIYFAEDKGKIWGIDTSDSLTTLWSYQDTGSGHGACSASSTCTVKALYVEPRSGRVYYGDQDGHVYVVSRNGSGGSLYSNYPVRPTGATTSDPFVTPPVYVEGVGGINGGVIAIGSSTGKVFFIDQKNGSSAPALIRMFHYGSAVSAISFRRTSTTTGIFNISTANGNTYYVDSADVADPTPSNN